MLLLLPLSPKTLSYSCILILVVKGDTTEEVDELVKHVAISTRRHKVIALCMSRLLMVCRTDGSVGGITAFGNVPKSVFVAPSTW